MKRFSALFTLASALYLFPGDLRAQRVPVNPAVGKQSTFLWSLVDADSIPREDRRCIQVPGGFVTLALPGFATEQVVVVQHIWKARLETQEHYVLAVQDYQANEALNLLKLGPGCASQDKAFHMYIAFTSDRPEESWVAQVTLVPLEVSISRKLFVALVLMP